MKGENAALGDRGNEEGTWGFPSPGNSKVVSVKARRSDAALRVTNGRCEFANVLDWFPLPNVKFG